LLTAINLLLLNQLESETSILFSHLRPVGYRDLVGHQPNLVLNHGVKNSIHDNYDMGRRRVEG
jgi:hypothetical protein